MNQVSDRIGGQEGHIARDCTSPDAVQGSGPPRRSNFQGGNSYGGSSRECYKCGGQGHIARFVTSHNTNHFWQSWRDCTSAGGNPGGWNQGGNSRGGQSCYVSCPSLVIWLADILQNCGGTGHMARYDFWCSTGRKLTGLVNAIKVDRWNATWVKRMKRKNHTNKYRTVVKLVITQRIVQWLNLREFAIPVSHFQEEKTLTDIS